MTSSIINVDECRAIEKSISLCIKKMIGARALGNRFLTVLSELAVLSFSNIITFERIPLSLLHYSNTF